LGLPARPELLFLARMTAAAVASRADFGYDQIEDLRLALDELCLTLLGEASTDARIQLSLGWDDDSIEVSASLVDPELTAPLSGGLPESGDEDRQFQSGSDFSERILDALVDEHGSRTAGGTLTCWMRMRRREGAA
jgi:hypothetical protein